MVVFFFLIKITSTSCGSSAIFIDRHSVYSLDNSIFIYFCLFIRLFIRLFTLLSAKLYQGKLLCDCSCVFLYSLD